MSDNETAVEQESTNVLADDQAADRFKGFSTKDGERVEPASQQAADDRPAAKGGDKTKSTARPAAIDSTDDESDDGAEATERHKSAQARINKAVGRQRAAERRAEALEQRLAALEARAPAGNDQQNTRSSRTVDSKGGDGPPKPADYDYGELDAGYIRDLTRYEVRQEMEAEKTASRQQNDNANRTEAQRQHQERLDAFYTKGIDIADDFEEVVSDQGLKVSPALGELILESDFGPQIAYEMASDPKEAKTVSAMSPARQAAWFGQREAELSSESSDAGEVSGQQSPPNRNSPKTTKAPPPPKGKTRGSGEAQQVSPATNDFAQFERLAMKQQD